MNHKPLLTTLFFPTLPLIAVVLGVVSIIAHNFLATSGPDLKSLESQVTSLTETNANLHQRLAQTSSLTRLKTTAENLGFTSPQIIVYLASPAPLAQK